MSEGSGADEFGQLEKVSLLGESLREKPPR